MKKITISIPDTLFDKSKIFAKKHHMTLNELVCKLLHENIDYTNQEILTSLFAEMDNVEFLKPANWNRGELYER